MVYFGVRPRILVLLTMEARRPDSSLDPATRDVILHGEQDGRIVPIELEGLSTYHLAVDLPIARDIRDWLGRKVSQLRQEGASESDADVLACSVVIRDIDRAIRDAERDGQ